MQLRFSGILSTRNISKSRTEGIVSLETPTVCKLIRAYKSNLKSRKNINQQMKADGNFA